MKPVYKYAIELAHSAGPEDTEAGRVWDVVHRQNWDNGKYLPPVASRCTKDDAERIAACLNACEGTDPRYLNANELVEQHALLKVRYSNLRCDGLGHLRTLVKLCEDPTAPGWYDLMAQALKQVREFLKFEES